MEGRKEVEISRRTESAMAWESRVQVTDVGEGEEGEREQVSTKGLSSSTEMERGVMEGLLLTTQTSGIYSRGYGKPGLHTHYLEQSSI